MTRRARSGPETIRLQDGAGGRAMRALIEEVFVRNAPDTTPSAADGVSSIGLRALDDGAALALGDRWLVLTTDSHVIQPVFFPGGDIGRLAVSGTVNDLAMMGATEALGLTCSVIVEEGFARADLERIQASIDDTCRESQASILAGDTKVMGRGELDGIALNTTGVALCERVVSDAGLRVGDRIVVTGTVGDHGLAVLAARSGLELEAELRSDVAPLNALIRNALLLGGEHVVAMKDPTRGGVASTLHEMAAKSGVGVVLDGPSVPMNAAVRAVGELLGIDPLHVANEGKAILGVAPEGAETVLAALRDHPLGKEAAVIGTCVAEHRGSVVLDTGLGRRLLTELEGEPLPRIC